MSKRVGEPIDVEGSAPTIEAFWWRGTRYQVRRVIGRWRETGGWWTGTDGQAPWAAGRACEILRVDAVGRARGVFEVARDLRSGSWVLHRVLD